MRQTRLLIRTGFIICKAEYKVTVQGPLFINQDFKKLTTELKPSVRLCASTRGWLASFSSQTNESTPPSPGSHRALILVPGSRAQWGWLSSVHFKSLIGVFLASSPLALPLSAEGALRGAKGHTQKCLIGAQTCMYLFLPFLCTFGTEKDYKIRYHLG